MSALVRGELIKLRTTRTALGFALATLLLVLAQVLITTLAGDPSTVDDKRSAIAVGGTIGVILLVFGIVGATGEFRHRTVAPAVLIAPDRVRLALSRVVAYGLAALLFGAGAIVVALVIGLALLGGQPGDDLAGSDYATVIVGGLAAAVLSTVLGVGVGLLVRNQVAGVVGALVWLFVLEPLTILIDDGIDDYLIGGASDAAAGGAAGTTDLPWGTGVAVLAAWTVAFMAAGLLMDRRRDVE